VPNSPLFPFGYGLSYTKFDYSDITLDKKELKGNEILSASVTVANTGNVAGEEVVQLYINDPVASISRPVKELKGYQKILLKPGESKVVHFDISTELLKFYNSKLKYDWEPGDFNLYIGTSSAEVKTAWFTWKK
jgi:beta-glucosidase